MLMIRNWPLLFIVIPLVELYFIIAVGEQIGAFWTIILVLLTAVVGVNLLRFQGMSTLARAQKNMAQGQDMGALPEIRASVDPAVKGGTYYGPDGKGERKGYPVVVPSNEDSHNLKDAAKLWEESERLTGVKFKF